MKTAVMQPYFFPYIGYWQLIDSVDQFIVFDDVNYIKGGWINRNRISSSKLDYFKLPLLGVSQNKKINEIKVNLDELFTKADSRILHETYRKAPFCSEIEPLTDSLLYIRNDNLAEYLTEQIKRICSLLGISTKILVSSQIPKDNSLKGEDKIIEICRLLGTDEYINLIGGTDLYHKDVFESNKISLKFLKSDLKPYRQFEDDFVPALSILDVLMFTGIDGAKEQLKEFTLLEP